MFLIFYGVSATRQRLRQAVTFFWAVGYRLWLYKCICVYSQRVSSISYSARGIEWNIFWSDPIWCSVFVLLVCILWADLFFLFSVVTGVDKKSLISAKTRILMMVASSRRRQAFTHFISIPFNSVSFKSGFSTFKVGGLRPGLLDLEL